MSQRSSARGGGSGPAGRRPKDARRQGRRSGTSTARVSGGRTMAGSATRAGLPADPRVLAAAGLAAVLVIVAIVFGVMGFGGGGGPSSPPASGSAGCPRSQPTSLARGQVREVTINTPKGSMVITVKGSLSPIAAGNFVALAQCGYYDGVVFHRTATLQSGAPFVIQGGDGQYGRTGSLNLSNVGQGGPGYTITDEPVTTTYHRGTVAMARTQDANSQGSQFFIVLSDSAGPILQGANPGYAIIGEVTTGMSVADAIYQASNGVELPPNPIPMTSLTVTDPNASPAASPGASPAASPAAS